MTIPGCNTCDSGCSDCSDAPRCADCDEYLPEHDDACSRRQTCMVCAERYTISEDESPSVDGYGTCLACPVVDDTQAYWTKRLARGGNGGKPDQHSDPTTKDDERDWK